MNQKQYPKGKNNNIVIQELNDEILVYKLIENKAFCLNQSSAMIWKLSDGNHSVAEIAQEVSKNLNSPVNSEFVWLALEKLKKEDLIESDIEFPADFINLSRREIIKKIGLATVVVLPIVSSINAPLAIQAASACLPAGASSTCTRSSLNAVAVIPLPLRQLLVQMQVYLLRQSPEAVAANQEHPAMFLTDQ